MIVHPDEVEGTLMRRLLLELGRGDPGVLALAGKDGLRLLEVLARLARRVAEARTPVDGGDEARAAS